MSKNNNLKAYPNWDPRMKTNYLRSHLCFTGVSRGSSKRTSGELVFTFQPSFWFNFSENINPPAPSTLCCSSLFIRLLRDTQSLRSDPVRQIWHGVSHKVIVSPLTTATMPSRVASFKAGEAVFWHPLTSGRTQPIESCLQRQQQRHRHLPMPPFSQFKLAYQCWNLDAGRMPFSPVNQ